MADENDRGSGASKLKRDLNVIPWSPTGTGDRLQAGAYAKAVTP